MAKFGPLRNQANYVSFDRFGKELSKNVLLIEFEPLYQMSGAFMSNFDLFYHDHSPDMVKSRNICRKSRNFYTSA